eukprot:CAMPEP_0198115554 /NCGR_PEP_ID=MMETSP1442-20131203/6625_1 /TAXON_ID= /ORGANISM="Craspedostauros australis, Strain CCMP3328" /LENGTH=67 /DNA_ID=CAMNT_0043773091 /DNA_START=34 /DNA_END=234 /DNA_ORIENTATION=-
MRPEPQSVVPPQGQLRHSQRWKKLGVIVTIVDGRVANGGGIDHLGGDRHDLPIQHGIPEDVKSHVVE